MPFWWRPRRRCMHGRMRRCGMAGDPDREAAERTLLPDVGHVRIDSGAGF